MRIVVKYKKKISILLGLLITLSGIILNYTYRDYIYSNHIYDYHLADTIGSILCVPASSFFFYGVYTKYKFKELIFKSTIAFVIYEFLTIFPFHGTFDYFDLIAILFGAGITYVFWIFYKITNAHKEKII